MDRYFSNFTELLGPIELQTLEKQKATVYAIDADFRLIYFNPAWVRFYSENSRGQAMPTRIRPGVPLLDFVQGPEKEYYETLYRKAMKEEQVQSHSYECHAPDRYRLFDQTVYPMKHGEGAVIVNSLLVEASLEDNGVEPSLIEQEYLQRDGFFHQCSNCRKTQRNDGSGIWDRIPQYIEQMPSNVSHSICPVCFDHYWKGGGESGTG